MKNVLRKSFVVALAICTFFTSAVIADPSAEDPDKLATSVYANKDSKITVAVKSAVTSRIMVQIFDNDGNHIFTDQIKDSEGFMRTYDLASAGPGKYTVKVSNADATSTKSVAVGAEKKEDFKAYFSSKFTENKIKVSYYNAYVPAEAIIYNHLGKEVAREVISANKDYSSIINLTQLSRGDYTLRIDSNGQGIEKAITIN